MGHNRMLLGIALLLAMVGGSAVASGMGSDAPAERTVTLSGGDRTRTTEQDDLFLKDELEDTTSTTSTTSPPVVVTSTTTSTPSRAAVTTTTSTTTSPTTSTTAVPNTATIRVVNNFSSAVTISINDVNSKTWTLDPGAKAGPFTLETASDHGDGATVTAVGTQCGYGDGEDYFTAGHTYLLEAKASAENCGDTPGPMLVIHDKTTGTSETIGP